ncbi:hypothetical protein Tco_1408570 [Tanacetum coccineum]
MTNPDVTQRDMSGYGKITDSWEEMVETLPELPVIPIQSWCTHEKFETMDSVIQMRSTRELGDGQWMRRSAHGEVIPYAPHSCTYVKISQSYRHGPQDTESNLRFVEIDRRRREEMKDKVQTLQREMVPLQGLVATLQGQVTDLQGQVMTLQGQVTTLQGQQGPAGGPAQPELPEEAGSSS